VPEDDHPSAAAEWLASAQDVMSDGGVAGRYRLAGGWTSSDPETTGCGVIRGGDALLLLVRTLGAALPPTRAWLLTAPDGSGW